MLGDIAIGTDQYEIRSLNLSQTIDTNFVFDKHTLIKEKCIPKGFIQ